jgi:hypothetical protein
MCSAPSFSRRSSSSSSSCCSLISPSTTRRSSSPSSPQRAYPCGSSSSAGQPTACSSLARRAASSGCHTRDTRTRPLLSGTGRRVCVCLCCVRTHSPWHSPASFTFSQNAPPSLLLSLPRTEARVAATAAQRRSAGVSNVEPPLPACPPAKAPPRPSGCASSRAACGAGRRGARARRRPRRALACAVQPLRAVRPPAHACTLTPRLTRSPRTAAAQMGAVRRNQACGGVQVGASRCGVRACLPLRAAAAYTHARARVALNPRRRRRAHERRAPDKAPQV